MSTNTHHRSVRLTVLGLLAVATVTTSCSGGDPAARAATPVPEPVATAAERAVPTTTVVERPAAAGLVTLSTEALVHSAPAGEVTATLPALTEFGSPMTLAVLDEADGWLQVALPVRPNGSTGWIERADLAVMRTTLSVHVDLDGRRLSVRDGDVEVISSPVAIGSPDTPTPTGAFYVTDLVANPEGSAYGPFAIGLSAHSDVLDQFGGGDGQIAIHGTSSPSSIGQAVSHGCVRIPNDVAVQLAAMLPLGTPVVIG